MYLPNCSDMQSRKGVVTQVVGHSYSALYSLVSHLQYTQGPSHIFTIAALSVT